ncbi:MAG: Protein NrdI, partial [Pseudarthrobacter sp.]|nr:Protein NrdI [Pseudarthrobacter sp.]
MAAPAAQESYTVQDSYTSQGISGRQPVHAAQRVDAADPVPAVVTGSQLIYFSSASENTSRFVS